MIKKTAQQKGGPAAGTAEAGTKKPSLKGKAQRANAGSEADTFDNVKPQGSIDDGKYEAVIREFVLQDPDEKGRSVRLKVAIADEGDFQGVEAAQFYKVFEADGSAGKGAAFLKADLVKLGYPDVRFADMEQVFEEIVEERTGILCTVKKNGQFTNIYVNGLSEDSEVIQAFLATNPF